MKRIYSLAALMVTAFLIIATLVYNAAFPNKYKNGFNRNYLQNKVTPVADIPTEGIIQDISGATATRFYFSTSNPEKIISTNHLFQDKKLISIHINKPLTDFFTAVDSPFVYVYAFNIPAVITADINTGNTETRQLPEGAYSNAQALGNNQFVLRKLIPEIPDQLFLKVTADSIIKEHHLSELYLDAGMCTDGLLHYDHNTHLFTYLHYYNNEYISFDSTLQHKISGHTIDTFSHFRFELSDKIAKTKHVFTSQGPDMMINGVSCVYKGILYVRSTLKADNDDATAYKNNIVIDTYQLQTGKYTGSFYIPGHGGEKINKMAIYDDILLIQGKDRIYTYRWYPSF
jgi:hypothetical protein